MQYKRIAIIGNAGSGKSTLAKRLHTLLGLPLIHLDQYFWKPGWTRPNPDEYKTIHDSLCDQEEWTMDGMNLRLLEYRIHRADIIIFLNIPRYICFWRIFKRLTRYYGKTRPSSPQGCPEGINWRFMVFLKWVWDFKKNYIPKVLEMLHAAPPSKKIYILTSQKQIDDFISRVF